MEAGYIKVYRSLMDKGYYNKPEYVALWVHLLMRANYTEREVLVDGKIKVLEPGQFMTSRPALSKATGIPPTTIERILDLFESEQQIGQVKTRKYRFITVLNWDRYQRADKQTDNWRTTGGQLADTDNKDKKDKKERRGEGHAIFCQEWFGMNHGDWLGLLVRGSGWRDWCDNLCETFGRDRVRAATPFIVDYLKRVKQTQARTFPQDKLRAITWDRIEHFAEPEEELRDLSNPANI